MRASVHGSHDQGYAYASQFRKERTAYRYTVEDSIYLDPDHRGKVCSLTRKRGVSHWVRGIHR